MKQTAVEWLVEQLNIWQTIADEDTNATLDTVRKLIEKALEMEKEQSECICVNVIQMILDESEQGKEINSKEIFEKCYKETFKSE